ncbi:portal protein [Photobacterium frigidiphilum]|uniref:portal protein n=1 Tax=Photobacterium frigidiphilum TaxID=264736 RepID=UPI003D0A69DE
MKTIRQQCDSIFQGLDSDYAPWESHYRELANYIQPRRQRFSKDSVNSGGAHNSNIIDPSATLAMRVAAGGMYSGITNPVTKWLRLNVEDKELNKYHLVRLYLDTCADLILGMLASSNFYNVVPSMFMDLLTYSGSSVGFEKDPLTVMRFYPNPIGSYRLGIGPRQNVSTHGRKIEYRVSQVVEKFGLDNVSQSIKSAYRSGKYNQLTEVRHLVFDNPDFVPRAFSAVRKPICSIWYDPADDRNPFLRRSGFDEFPFVTPRWEVIGNDTYGSFGPGMLALGSIKGLQKDQRDKYEAQDKMLKPPMVGPSSLKNNPRSLLPGAVTFVDNQQGQQGFTPAFQTNFPLNYQLESIRDTRAIIDSAFFKDLFLAVIDIGKSNTTATEIAARKEEKLLMLGPVLNRFNEEGLDPIVSASFYEMNRRGMLPEPPPELDGVDVNIEYVGLLQQAQKAVGISSIERTVGFIGNLAGVRQDVLDKVDFDSVVDIYTDITGTTPRILFNEQQVKATRDARIQQQQREQMAAMAAPAKDGAEAAKLLSETRTDESNGLSNFLGI